MEKLDYRTLMMKVISSPEFKDLKLKESPVLESRNAQYFAHRVGQFAEKIAYHADIDQEYCKLLAFIKFLGIPEYGREGRIALGKRYSQSDVNIRLAQKRLRINLSEEMKEDIRQVEIENINDITSNAARVVVLAQNIAEDLEQLSMEEMKELGGITLSNILIEECSLDKDGKLIPGSVYNKITPVLQERRKPIDNEKIKKAKENLRENKER